MGGIVGVLGADSLEKLCAAALAMLRAEAHRGPDDESLVALMTAEPVRQTILGYRRLSLTDSSSKQQQPVQNENGGVWVVLDGQIYNAEALRGELRAKGHRFRSNASAEVVLRVYEEHGAGGLSRVKGMFAVAVWDHELRRLLLARDRCGEKPLYYSWDGSRFVFASEIKALLASGLIARRLNPTAVAAYLNLGSIPSPLTIIDGVRCLDPGSLLIFQEDQVRVEPYWNLLFKEENAWSEAQAGEGLREHVREAVRLRLTSNGSGGAFISGGMGSSALLSIIRETLAGELRTFSVAFDGSRRNGRTPARTLAERFETRHSERVVSSDEVLRELDRIVAAMDQPSVNAIRSYFVSRTARALNARVALCGLGGDELFGGYSTFWLVPRLLNLSRLPERFGENSRSLRALLSRLPLDGERHRTAAFLRQTPSLERAYLAAKGLCLDNPPERILSGRFIGGSAAFDPEVYLKEIGAGHTESPSNRICRLELLTDLHNRFLRDGDAMSMAHSVEMRAPFLDDRVIEFLTEVPASVKFASRQRDLLGETVAAGSDLQFGDHEETADLGFLDSWLKHEWREVAGEILSRPNAMSVELFDRDRVRQLWGSFLRRRAPWSKVWSVLILQLWIRHHIDGEICLLPLGYQFAREA